MLHRLSRIKGAHIYAVDGEIGHVDDVLVDEQSSAIKYFVVDTSNWIGGKWVAISPAALTAVDWADGRLEVNLTREQIQNGPRLESVDVAPAEALPNYAFIF